MENKKTYEKPVIAKIEPTFTNKMGTYSHGSNYHIRSKIDNIPLEKITEKFGSPVFVFSEKKIRENYRKYFMAFSSRYPNVQPAWSYKTNYLGAICNIFHQEGAIAEVVSYFEYQKARKLGVPGDKIIFNGPYKDPEGLELAAKEDAKIHIEQFEEIILLENIAKKLNKKVKVGIRLNMDTGIRPFWSRFGFNLDNGQAENIAERVIKSEYLTLVGLHTHIGTFIIEPNAYKTATTKIIDFSKKLKNKYGIEIEYFDLGGGFPSKNRLKGTYLPPEILIQDIDKYAEAITDTFMENFSDGDYPLLYLESGRHLIEDTGYLISTVKSTKRLPDGRRSYVIDAGVNLLFTSFWYDFKIEIEKEISGPNELSVIYGPLCMNIDVISEKVFLPPLPEGTKVVISPVGAYNVTQWMQFISFRPNVVIITEEGDIELIREKEQLEDIISKERIPEKFLK